jgi:hypothetical protein
MITCSSAASVTTAAWTVCGWVCSSAAHSDGWNQQINHSHARCGWCACLVAMPHDAPLHEISHLQAAALAAWKGNKLTGSTVAAPAGGKRSRPLHSIASRRTVSSLQLEQITHVGCGNACDQLPTPDSQQRSACVVHAGGSARSAGQTLGRSAHVSRIVAHEVSRHIQLLTCDCRGGVAGQPVLLLWRQIKGEPAQQTIPPMAGSPDNIRRRLSGAGAGNQLNDTRSRLLA